MMATKLLVSSVSILLALSRPRVINNNINIDQTGIKILENKVARSMGNLSEFKYVLPQDALLQL